MRYLIANWKMHGSHVRVREFAFALNRAMATAPASLAAVFCPPFTYLETARTAMPLNTRVALGGQNCARDAEGAFTGGISAPMLKDCGAGYVILGHSERRLYMHETDDQVSAKMQAAYDAGLTPIVCVGETEQEYNEGKTLDVLACQLKNWVKGEALVAYEPVWAIGTGRTPTTVEIGKAHAHIKSILGSAQPVLYGGSVKSANIKEILAIEAVDGALIGGASLKIDEMAAMINAASS